MEEEEKDYMEEEEDREERRPQKGGIILRLELTHTGELMALPMRVSCFEYVGCLDFCQMIQRVQHHPFLSIDFISNLRDN